MRKIIIASAIAVVAFAGQALASEGVASVTPQLGQMDYRLGDRVGSANDGQDQAIGNTGLAIAALLIVAGVATSIALTDHHSQKPASAQ